MYRTMARLRVDYMGNYIGHHSPTPIRSALAHEYWEWAVLLATSSQFRRLLWLRTPFSRNILRLLGCLRAAHLLSTPILDTAKGGEFTGGIMVERDAHLVIPPSAIRPDRSSNFL